MTNQPTKLSINLRTNQQNNPPTYLPPYVPTNQLTTQPTSQFTPSYRPFLVQRYLFERSRKSNFCETRKFNTTITTVDH